MTEEKFQNEIRTLDKFFTKFCHDKHENQFEKTYELAYKQSYHHFTLDLCEECHDLITYSFQKLVECPHEIKPRCRRCPNPCYEKPQWKRLAKLMRYSGVKLGIEKVMNFVKKN